MNFVKILDRYKVTAMSSLKEADQHNGHITLTNNVKVAIMDRKYFY